MIIVGRMIVPKDGHSLISKTYVCANQRANYYHTLFSIYLIFRSQKWS